MDHAPPPMTRSSMIAAIGNAKANAIANGKKPIGIVMNSQDLDFISFTQRPGLTHVHGLEIIASEKIQPSNFLLLERRPPPRKEPAS